MVNCNGAAKTMKNKMYFTFDEYVEEIRKTHVQRLDCWSRGQRIEKIVREHGGPDFRNFRDLEREHLCPSYPEIPNAPDINIIAPYCRVTLSAPCPNGITVLLRQSRLLLRRVEADSLRPRFSLSDCVLGSGRAPR